MASNILLDSLECPKVQPYYLETWFEKMQQTEPLYLRQHIYYCEGISLKINDAYISVELTYNSNMHSYIIRYLPNPYMENGETLRAYPQYWIKDAGLIWSYNKGLKQKEQIENYLKKHGEEKI